MNILSPHCGVEPESTSGGEVYERELLWRMARKSRLRLILARHKDATVFNVRRLPIARGLRWWNAPAIVTKPILDAYIDEPFDLLRVHSVRMMGPSALLARHWLRMPIVAHHHHLDGGWLTWLDRAVITRVNAVIVGSRFARRQLFENQIYPDEVWVVPYGHDPRCRPGPPLERLLTRHALNHRPPIVLTISGLKKRKNLMALLAAWDTVSAQQPTARLLIVGDGPERRRLEAHAAERGIARSVIFAGYVPEAEKPDYLRLTDVYVSTSLMEGFGLSILDAMATGLPVVASDRGAIPELVEDGRGGMLCDPEQTGWIAWRLLRVLEDRELREDYGRHNLKRAAAFTWDACVNRTLEVYEEIITGMRARA